MDPATAKGDAIGSDSDQQEKRVDRHVAVQLRNVHKTYLLGLEGVPALRGVDVTINKGEFVVVLGKSGGGKTSLLNIIGTVDRPTRGELFVAGVRVDSKTPDSALAAIRLRKLAFVFQQFNLLPTLSALENVELPMVLAGWGSRTARRKRAIHLLSRVGMAERLHHTPAQMSGGEQQRVTIARALSNRPSVLLLDEPTGDLDTVNSQIVMKLLTDLNVSEGVTMVMVTHDTSLKQYAHRVLHMLDGRLHRQEAIPPFLRQEALEALASSPAVVAMQGLQAKKRAEAARLRQMRTAVGAAAEGSNAVGKKPRFWQKRKKGGADDGTTSDDEEEGDEENGGAAAYRSRFASAGEEVDEAEASVADAELAKVESDAAAAAQARKRAASSGGSGGDDVTSGGGLMAAAQHYFASIFGGGSRNPVSAAAAKGDEPRSATINDVISGSGVGGSAGSSATSAGSFASSAGSQRQLVKGQARPSSAIRHIPQPLTLNAGAGGTIEMPQLSSRTDVSSSSSTEAHSALPSTVTSSSSAIDTTATAAAATKQAFSFASPTASVSAAGSEPASAESDVSSSAGGKPRVFSSASSAGSSNSDGDGALAAASVGMPGALHSPATSATSATAVYHYPAGSSTHNTGTTAGGLSGVAAISHQVFAASYSGAAAPQANSPTASASSAAAVRVGSRTMTRTPDSYATHIFAKKAAAAAAAEAAERAAAAAAKEARLRAMVAAQREARLAAAVLQGGQSAYAKT